MYEMKETFRYNFPTGKLYMSVWFGEFHLYVHLDMLEIFEKKQFLNTDNIKKFDSTKAAVRNVILHRE